MSRIGKLPIAIPQGVKITLEDSVIKAQGPKGTLSRRIMEGVRKDLAGTYVRDLDVELVEIAFLLGFSDQSAFSRAFKRWTGNTPSEFRMSG